MSLADEAGGRTISQSIYIRLTPIKPIEVLGHTDAAMEIGRGLIAEAVKVLVMAAEAEGFKVDVTVGQVVY